MRAQFVAFLLAVWLTAAPDILGYTHPARANDHIVGPLAATVSLTAVFQVTRAVRWLNVLTGTWLIVAPWILGYIDRPETIQSVIVGIGLTGVASVRGAVPESFGGGWESLWRPERASVG